MSFPVFLLLIFLFKSDLSKSEADTRSTIISALEKATFFLANKYMDINLDAVSGFSVLQAHLKGALEKWASEHELQSQQARVERLVKKLSSLIEKATHSLGQSDPKYFKEFEPSLAPNFWMLPHSWNQTDSSLAYTMFDSIGCFTEEMSDKCFTYLLGTWKDNGTSCIVTKACRNIMTKFGCSDYSLSHQLFYFMVADMKGCSDRLFLRAQYYKNIFCASMMKINLMIESNGFRFSSRDLFMENIMFCGMSGFSDFYKPSWLETVLTWQKPEEGCFGKPSENSEHPSRVKDQEQLLRRVKRREKVFADGCSSHNTAVAVGVLGGFLYYY
uniref:Chromosome 16 open reading frame 89 n=1 Tax=Chelydra serpentina TaxID=8475 RepID=A0A8C3RW11_CHESE